MKQIVRSFPCTVSVALMAIGLLVIPTDFAWLETNFESIGAGQWWRIWTGHLLHFDSNHLIWDLLMFVVLGTACERGRSRTFAVALMVLGALITASLAIYCPEITVYRGLSGIDTGLFVWLVVEQIQHSFSDRRRSKAFLWCLALLGLAGKLTFEATTGQTLFVDSNGFQPLVESHLAGLVGGLLISIGLSASVSSKMSSPGTSAVDGHA